MLQHPPNSAMLAKCRKPRIGFSPVLAEEFLYGLLDATPARDGVSRRDEQ
jgi:hypothetical protein